MKIIYTIISFIILASSVSAQAVDIDVVNRKLQIKSDSLKPKSLFDNSMLGKSNFKSIYLESLGLFCKAENKFSESAKMPIKMRLGTVQYVDKIEGK